MQFMLCTAARHNSRAFSISSICAACVVFFSLNAWAQAEGDKKAAEPDLKKTLENQGCQLIAIEKGHKLSTKDLLMYAPPGVLASLSKIENVDEKDIEEVRVRLNDGRELFLVPQGTMSFQCDKKLPGTAYLPLETTNDLRLEINPCCSLTIGGGNVLTWSKVACKWPAVQVPNPLCGH